MRYISLIGLLIISINSAYTSQNLKAKSSVNQNGFEISVLAPALQKISSKNGSNTITDYVEYTDPSKAGALKLPWQELIIALPPNSKPSITFTPGKSTVIANSSVRLNPKQVWKGNNAWELEEQTKPSMQITSQTPQFEIGKYFWYRDLYCVHVRVRLAGYNYANNSVEELSSYKISVSFPGSNAASAKAYVAHNDLEAQMSSIIANADIAESFRSSQPKAIKDSTLDWISFGASYAKIGVTEDRIYRISRHDLEVMGIVAAEIQPYTFRLFESGKEVPLFLSSQDTLTFGSSDFIEFYGRKNYSPISPRIVNPDTVPYYTYLNPFSDTTVYFLTWGAASGRHTPKLNTSLSGLSETLEYYTDFIHAETDTIYQDVSASDPYKNQDPTRLDAKSWFGGYVYGGNNNSGNVDLQTSDVLPGKTASVYARLISVGSDLQFASHSIALGVRNFPAKSGDTLTTIIDQRTIDRNDIAVLKGNIPSDSIKSGLNTIAMRSWKNGTSTNYLFYDWVELEYPRALKAKNDSLYFEYRDSSLTNALRIIKVSNLSSSTQDTAYTVYRIKPSVAKIFGAVKSGTTLSFADTVGFGSAYYVIANTKINDTKPFYLKKKSFVNLRSASHKADYIAISHPLLFNSASAYTAFIKTQYKIDTALVMVDDIYDEFAFGYPDPSSIRSFLKAAFQNWQSPKPSALMLLGQACYDYKNYYDQKYHDQTNFNLVPSYGEPVSDAWFTMFADTSLPLQQMLVGRLPAKKEADLLGYLTKHQNYVSQRYDLWNKRAILFSGGDAADTSQIKQLKVVNDQIISASTSPKPLSLNTDHFYKTFKPVVTSYGPYDPKYFQHALDLGGLFISYIGHSATRTWDNDINDPNQLLNKVNKSPLVTDFGCSTNRFAEPNVSAFGELFINTGQTISYLGNSSFGFINTTTTVPQIFYSILLKDSVRQIALAHFKAKLRMFGTLGSTGSYRIFAYTNVMLGDPVIRLAVPTKPNLTILDSNIVVLNSVPPNDGKLAVDSVRVVYKNYGLATTDSVDIEFQDHYDIGGRDSVIFAKDIRVRPVEFSDTVIVVVPTEGKPGRHIFTVQIDKLKKIDELYTDDNTASLSSNVASLSVKVITPNTFSSQPNSVTLIGSTAMPDSHAKDVIVQFDTHADFSAPRSLTVTLDTFFTKVLLTSLQANTRFFGRASFNQTDTLWSNIFQVYKSTKALPFLLEDAYSFNQMGMTNVSFDNGLKILIDTVKLELRSSGQFLNSGSVNRNGVNLLDNSSGWGVGVAIIDPVTLKADTGKFFYYGAEQTAANADSLASLLHHTPSGKIVCLVVITDGSHNKKQYLIDEVKACGSTLFEGLREQEPWAFMGIKGGKVFFEKKESNTFNGYVVFDTALIHRPESAYLTTTAIDQTSKYTSVAMDVTNVGNSSVSVIPVGYKSNGTIDTLTALSFNSSGVADISGISPATYPALRFVIRLLKSSDNSSPVVNSFGVNYDGYPELGVNYQSVISLSSSYEVGKKDSFSVSVANAGSVKADNVKVSAEIVYKDNSKITLPSWTIPTIPAESRNTYKLDYSIPVGPKDRTLRITLDPDNTIKEYYKDNNVFNLPFTVTSGSTDTAYVQFSVKDSTSSTLSHVFEGDYVSGKSMFQVEMYDSSLYAVSDTTFIKIFLDDKQYFYDSLQYKFNDLANPKMVVSFQPRNYALEAGDHFIRIAGVSGSRKVAIDTTIKFSVSNDLQLLSVYNYPNPFNPAKGNTHFTFQLTSLPDELQLKIYTVSGRLIRKINQNLTELNTGFNKTISWDGRDEDGDLVANGVYLYKILVKRNGKSVESVSKLAIIR